MSSVAYITNVTAELTSELTNDSTDYFKLNIGDTLHIKVHFTESVNVNGTLKLLLNNNVEVFFQDSLGNGNGTDTLIFNYQVTKDTYSNNLAYKSEKALLLIENGIVSTNPELENELHVDLELPSPGSLNSLSGNHYIEFSNSKNLYTADMSHGLVSLVEKTITNTVYTDNDFPNFRDKHFFNKSGDSVFFYNNTTLYQYILNDNFVVDDTTLSFSPEQSVIFSEEILYCAFNDKGNKFYYLTTNLKVYKLALNYPYIINNNDIEESVEECFSQSIVNEYTFTGFTVFTSNGSDKIIFCYN